jgi:phospholipase D1/2
MMIVDDKRIIIGSANINDRSLLGTRDSELALVMEDPKGKPGYGKIFEFRAQIFKEHFGLSEKNVLNIHSYWSKLVEIGQRNAEIYRKVFGCIPDNTAPHFSDVERLEK